MLQPLYHDLVTAINNADTIITLVIPSLIIVVCNVRISVALSRFYRSVEARTLRRSSGSALVNQLTLGYHCRTTDQRRRWSTQSSATIYSNSSYNRLQMKVGHCRLLHGPLYGSHWVLHPVRPSVRPSVPCLRLSRSRKAVETFSLVKTYDMSN